MTKITEIIPEDIPVWAKDAMERGQLFSEMVTRMELARRIESHSTTSLLKEIIKRKDCGQAAPSRIDLHGNWNAATVAMGKDNTATILFEDEGWDAVK